MTTEQRLHVEVTADRQFGTNSYLVEDEATHDAVVIDANLEPELIIDLVRQRGEASRPARIGTPRATAARCVARAIGLVRALAPPPPSVVAALAGPGRRRANQPGLQ